MTKLKMWKFGISPDKFIADCVDLTDDEIGKYFRFLCYAWKNEAHLPNDIDRINRIIKNPNLESTKYILERFFKMDESGYYCPAQLEEWNWVQEKSDKATESAEKRWGKNAMPTHSESNANYSHSNNNNKIINNAFNEIWNKLKIKRGTKAKGLKAYTKIHNKVEPTILIAKYNEKYDSVEDKQFVPHFSTWLNAEGWTEELITKQTKEDYNFGIVPRDPFRNLSFWQKGRRLPQDFDGDIMQKYKEGKITKESMEKMGFSV